MSVLTVNHLSKSFGKLEVLKDISLTVDKGEVVSIIGPSGSGKSTLLRCINQFERIDRGEIEICGIKMATNDDKFKAVYADKASLHEIRLKIGLVFQNFNLFPHMSVLKNITEAPIRVLKQSKVEAEETAMSLLKKMGLEDKADEYPCNLSGGQQQRVSIGRALLNNPAILLADEPTGNLDSENSKEIINLLRKFNKENNQTVIIITHDERIANSADRIIEIEDGKITRDEVNFA